MRRGWSASDHMLISIPSANGNSNGNGDTGLFLAGSQPKNLSKREVMVWRAHRAGAALRDPVSWERVFHYHFSGKCHQLLSTYLKPHSLYYTQGCHPSRVERSWKEAATAKMLYSFFHATEQLQVSRNEQRDSQMQLKRWVTLKNRITSYK